MTLTGEITTMLGVLGLPQGDGEALDAMVLVGMPSETKEITDGDSSRLYLTAREAGTDFLFEDRELTSVIIRTQPKAKYGAYPRPDALIDGLPGTATRDDVLALLGEPEWSGPVADRFLVDGRYAHFEYDPSNRIARITLMMRAP